MSANDKNAREAPFTFQSGSMPENAEILNMAALDRLSAAELEEKKREAWERVIKAASRANKPSHPNDPNQTAANEDFARKMRYYNVVKKEVLRRQGETPDEGRAREQGATSRSPALFSGCEAQPSQTYSTIDAQADRRKAAVAATSLEQRRKMALAASMARVPQPQSQPERPGNMPPAYSPRDTPDRARAPPVSHPSATAGPPNTPRPPPPAYNNGNLSVVDYSRSSTSKTESLFIDGSLRDGANGRVTMSQEKAIREEALQNMKKSHAGILRPQFLGPDHPPYYTDYNTTWTEALEEDQKIIKLAIESGLKAHEWQDIPPAKLLAAGIPQSRVRKVEEGEMNGQSGKTASKVPAVTIAHGSNIAPNRLPGLSLAQLASGRVPNISMAAFLSDSDTTSTETPATPALSAKAAGKRPMGTPVKNGNQVGSLSGETTPVARPGTPVVAQNTSAIEERETTTVIVAQNVLSRMKADDQHSRYLEHLARQNEARSTAPATKKLTINTKACTPAGQSSAATVEQAKETAARSETTSTVAQTSDAAVSPCPDLAHDAESLSESDGFSDVGGQSDAEAVVNADGWIEVEGKRGQ
ncbi:hypothetical protein CC79DRAFT_574013 [Sarocladium strictum]